MPVLYFSAVALGLLASLGVWYFGRKGDKQRAMRFRARADLSISESWKNFCQQTGVPLEAVESAMVLVENATGVSRSKLRPEDRFATDLAPQKGWEFDDGLSELRWALESQGHVDTSGIATVGDFVRLLSGRP